MTTSEGSPVFEKKIKEFAKELEEITSLEVFNTECLSLVSLAFSLPEISTFAVRIFRWLAGVDACH